MSKAEITMLLYEFLAGQGNGAASHDRFWSEDLVYTSSSGKVMSKTDIMASCADAPKIDESQPRDPETTFTATEILVRPCGEMAALTFRLVAHNPDGNPGYCRNSGTLLRRNGKWQVITWQATKEPVPE